MILILWTAHIGHSDGIYLKSLLRASVDVKHIMCIIRSKARLLRGSRHYLSAKCFIGIAACRGFINADGFKNGFFR